MTIHKCEYCNSEFKFKCLLQRHLNLKKKCNPSKPDNIAAPINLLPTNLITDANGKYNDQVVYLLSLIIKDKLSNISNSLFANVENVLKNNSIETFLSLIDKTNIQATLHNQQQQPQPPLEVAQKPTNVDVQPVKAQLEIAQIQNNSVEMQPILEVKEKKYICNACNNSYYHRQHLSRHKKKCINNLTKNTKQDTVLPTNALPTGSTINTEQVIGTQNNTNNIINITNNITNITMPHPFGYESLEHITFKDFKNIFSDLNEIMFKVCNYVYTKNDSNKSFYKINQNKNIVTYLDKNFDVVNTSENTFIDELKKNIHVLAIELFHIFKEQISINELILYMRNLLKCINTKDKSKEDDNIKSTLKAVVDKIFRDDEIKSILENMEKEMKKNPSLKSSYISKYTERDKLQTERMNEYSNPPVLAIQDNIQDNIQDSIQKKNIGLIRDQAFKANTDEVLHMINR